MTKVEQYMKMLEGITAEHAREGNFTNEAQREDRKTARHKREMDKHRENGNNCLQSGRGEEGKGNSR